MNTNNVFPGDAGIIEPRFHPPCDSRAGHTPVLTTQATITVAAGTNGDRYVVTGFDFNIAPSSGVIALTTVGAFVIDGATAETTYLFAEVMAVGTTGALNPIRRSGLNIVGSRNTALTIEFSKAITGALESVNVFYHKLTGSGT